MGEVIGHSQTLDAPPMGQAVGDEHQAPDFIDLRCHREGQAFAGSAFHLFANRQLCLAVRPIYPLVI